MAADAVRFAWAWTLVPRLRVPDASNDWRGREAGALNAVAGFAADETEQIPVTDAVRVAVYPPRLRTVLSEAHTCTARLSTPFQTCVKIRADASPQGALLCRS